MIPAFHFNAIFDLCLGRDFCCLMLNLDVSRSIDRGIVDGLTHLAGGFELDIEDVTVFRPISH
jgi:hypothetical protein